MMREGDEGLLPAPQSGFALASASSTPPASPPLPGGSTGSSDLAARLAGISMTSPDRRSPLDNSQARFPPRLNIDLASRSQAIPESWSAGSLSARSPGQIAAGTSFASSAAVQEGAILASVRRQLETLEERLGGQISRIQVQSDRLRDVALSRVDAKVHAMEQMHPKLDRRMAELSGNFKGLSDEMQAQIRRVDQMDARLWEWRHSLEEEVRSKFSDLETNHQQISSNMRVSHATGDDLLKRFNKRLIHIESIIDGKVASADDTNQSLLNLHQRLQDIEMTKNDLVPQELATSQMSPPEDANAIAALETRIAETCERLERLRQEVHENHTRVETQEERLKSLRTLFETKDEHLRGLNDRLERTDWEGRFKEVGGYVNELKTHRLDLSEKLEVCQRKLESHEHMHEETNTRLRSITRPPSSPRDVLGLIREGEVGSDVGIQMKEYILRVTDSENRIDELVNDVNAIRNDIELMPKLNEFIEQLKVVIPKQVDQEESIRDLHDKVGHHETQLRSRDTQLRAGRSPEESFGQAAIQAPVGVDPDMERRFRRMEDNLNNLAVQTQRITIQIEGEPLPSINGFEGEPQPTTNGTS